MQLPLEQWWTTAQAAISGQAVASCTTVADQLLGQRQQLHQWLLAQLLLNPPLAEGSVVAWRSALLVVLMGQQLGWRAATIRPLILACLSHGWHRQPPTLPQLQALAIHRPDWQRATLACYQWLKEGNAQGNVAGALCGLARHWAQQLHYLSPESALARCWRNLAGQIPFELWQAAAAVAAASGAGLMVKVGKDPALVIAASEPVRVLLLGGEHKGKKASIHSQLLRDPRRAPEAAHEVLLTRIEVQPQRSPPCRRLSPPAWWPALALALAKGRSPRQLAPLFAHSASLCQRISDAAQGLMRADVSRAPELPELLARLGQQRLQQLAVCGAYLDPLCQWPGPGSARGQQLLWHYLQLFSLLADELRLAKGTDSLLLALCYGGSLMLHPQLHWPATTSLHTSALHPGQLLGIDDLAGLRRRSRYLAHRWQLAAALRPTLTLAGRSNTSDPRQRLAALLQLTSVIQQRLLQPQPEPWPPQLCHWLGISPSVVDGWLSRADLPPPPHLP